MTPAHAAQALKPVAGFEGTAYAWAQGRLVWAGGRAVTDHPRNWHSPWQPPAQRLSATRLRHSGRQLLTSLRSGRGPVEPRGWLLWMCGRPLPFPMQAAQGRLQALRDALWSQDLEAFEAAALRLLQQGCQMVHEQACWHVTTMSVLLPCCCWSCCVRQALL